jgi:hypothetical protein
MELQRYECRQGLTNATMRIKTAEIAGSCSSTDIFKEKLTHAKEILLTKETHNGNSQSKSPSFKE